jgi:hypothetical protein
MGKRTVSIETPGEPPADPTSEPNSSSATADVEGGAGAPTTSDASAPMPADDLKAMAPGMSSDQENKLKRDLELTKDLVGSPEALDWSHLTGAAAIAASKADPDAGLPATADPATIDRPVLTKGGWVLPQKDARTQKGPE